MEEITELRQRCEKYELAGREILAEYSDAELAEMYNGAGPDAWPDDLRGLLTRAMLLFKPAVLIHDVQYTFSDGTEAGFAQTVSDWRTNCHKIFAADWPLWTMRMLSKAYRRERLYWYGVMTATNFAIATAAARDAWLAAYRRRSQNV